MEILSEVFWTTFTTSILALIAFSIRVCLRSKCDNVEICCIKVHRNVALEGDVPDIENIYGHNLNNEEDLDRN